MIPELWPSLAGEDGCPNRHRSPTGGGWQKGRHEQDQQHRRHQCRSPWPEGGRRADASWHQPDLRHLH